MKTHDTMVMTRRKREAAFELAEMIQDDIGRVFQEHPFLELADILLPVRAKQRRAKEEGENDEV